MIKYMLDTNILIYTIRKRPKKVRDAFKEYSDNLSMSTITLGELVYGAEKSSQPARNLADIEALAARVDVLPFDSQAAQHFGQVRAELAKAGKPIGPYDLMIAGHARSRGLILVTNNLREFKRVPGLRLENWVR
ncbi:MAG: tRNA(fMet)-specific endonuclease VapC [Gammaproteobacteria bacterium]|nr:tRNA(fMet)-specific endonuclease VapC [Gammaproteobacteria bacterium]MCZ6762699.1 tRNA(fMet)-specific endonuclease VapC [Gammaproteobacteria bacterium]